MEEKIRDANVRAFLNEPMGRFDVNDVTYQAIRHFVAILEREKDKVTECMRASEKAAKEYIAGAETEEDKKHREYETYNSFFPYAGRQALKCVLASENYIKECFINKKNIEFITNFSIKQYAASGHIIPESWIKLIEDKSLYNLNDVCFNLVIYRVGKYSYYAVEATHLPINDFGDTLNVGVAEN